MGCGASSVAPEVVTSHGIIGRGGVGGADSITFDVSKAHPDARSKAQSFPEAKDVDSEYVSRTTVALPVDRMKDSTSSVSATSSVEVASSERRGVSLKVSQLGSRFTQDPLRILLLGTAESGKTTIKHQIKIMSHLDFSQQDRVPYAVALHHNLISNMQQILRGLQILRRDLAPRTRMSASIIQTLTGYESLTPELARHMAIVWIDPAVQDLVNSPTASSVVADSMTYLMDNLDSLASSTFVPTVQDIARVRIRTTGIVDSELLLQGRRWEIIDVGGLRSERGKWVKLFPGTAAVIYMASLASFDMALHEDPTVNRMDEALHLFEVLCSEAKLANTLKFVILTKIDVLRDKLAKGVRIAHYFPWYTGENEVEPAVRFFEEAFLSVVPDRNLVRIAVVDATNYNDVSTQFESIFTEVLQASSRSTTPR